MGGPGNWCVPQDCFYAKECYGQHLGFSSVRHTALAAKGRVAITELTSYWHRKDQLVAAMKPPSEEEQWRRAAWPLEWQTRLEKWFRATPYWVLYEAVNELKELGVDPKAKFEQLVRSSGYSTMEKRKRMAKKRIQAALRKEILAHPPRGRTR